MGIRGDAAFAARRVAVHVGVRDSRFTDVAGREPADDKSRRKSSRVPIVVQDKYSILSPNYLGVVNSSHGFSFIGFEFTRRP
jgi:hypothetical protein